MIKYKIIEIDETRFTFVVRYYTDLITEESLSTDTRNGVVRRCVTDYNIDLPLVPPVGDELHEFIMSKAPTRWFNKMETLLDPQVRAGLQVLTPLLNIEETENREVSVQHTTKKLKSAITRATQERLDIFAQTRNYDGILSACTYATSTIPKFAAEGQHAVNMRDLTWATLYTVMAEVEAGTRPMPTGFADIEPDLPALVWPT